MNTNAILPTIETNEDCSKRGSLRFSHPAFGVVRVSHPRGGLSRMFGSRILHDSRVCVQIDTAIMDRNLSNDWIHGQKSILELEFTEAQWAHFVSSSGDGTGTPCTFTHLPKDFSTCPRVPDIAGDPDVRPDFHEEIREEMRRSVGRLDAVISDVQALIAGKGAIGKRDGEKALHDLRVAREHIVGNTAFVARQFAEHMETTTTEAIIAVEAFAANYAKDLGFSVLRGEKTLADQSEGNKEV